MHLESQKLHLKLAFPNPGAISPDPQPDELVIDVKNVSLFYSPVVENHLTQRTFDASIIKQIPDSASNRATLASAASSKRLVLILLLITALVNVFFPGPLKALVSLARALQLILHLQILSINTPGLVRSFFQLLIPVAMFDILELLQNVPGWNQYYADFLGEGNPAL